MARSRFAWLFVATALAAPGARAQNAPLNGLPQRGTVQSTDIIPIMPAGGAQLMQTTVAGLVPGGGTGSVTSVSCGAGLTGGTITTAGTCALAAPSATTLGGVQSFAAETHEFINAISTAGVASAARPACADLADATYCNVSLTNGVTLANLAQASANSLLGNAGATMANVAEVPVPSCSGAGYALDYTSGAGFGCVNVGETGVAPNLLKFGPPTVLPYYDPQPAGLIDVTDTFGSTGTFTQQAGFGTPSFSVASNVGTVSCGTACGANFLETSDATLVAPDFFNAEEVTALSTGGGYFNIYAGACKDINNYVGAYYDGVGHAIHTEYDYAGTIQNSSVLSVTLTPPFWIGVSLVGNGLTAWYKHGATGPWVEAGNVWTGANYDYTVTANFASAGYKTCFKNVWNAAGSASVANLQGGRFGGVAMRDLKPVVNNDWTTYEPGSNTIYFVASAVDPAGVGAMGVFTLDLATQVVTETGVVCDARTFSAVAHTYCGDSAGNIIYHANGDREVLLSSWNTGFSNTTPVQVLYEYLANGTQPDVLTNNLSVLSMTQLTLPLGSEIGAYDPALAYDSAHSLYRMAYSVCGPDCTFGASTSAPDFFPAQATATTPTGTWTLVGIDTAATGNFEGTSWANVSGALYELAGGPHYSLTPTLGNCTSSRVYDETMTYQGGLLGATFDTNFTAGAPCSHPTLFQHPDGIHEVVLTFLGGEFTSGNLSTVGQPAIEISTP